MCVRAPGLFGTTFEVQCAGHGHVVGPFCPSLHIRGVPLDQEDPLALLGIILCSWDMSVIAFVCGIILFDLHGRLTGVMHNYYVMSEKRANAVKREMGQKRREVLTWMAFWITRNDRFDGTTCAPSKYLPILRPAALRVSAFERKGNTKILLDGGSALKPFLPAHCAVICEYRSVQAFPLHAACICACVYVRATPSITLTYFSHAALLTICCKISRKSMKTKSCCLIRASHSVVLPLPGRPITKSRTARRWRG